MQIAKPDRVLVFLGGLAGSAGVALSAAAAHRGGGNMATAASFLLMHAPALLVMSLFAGSKVARYGGYLIALGLILFCGDLLTRQFLGDRLFPYAAPSGGMMMIGGWIVVAISALFNDTGRSAD